jgi:hypothetical protein
MVWSSLAADSPVSLCLPRGGDGKLRRMEDVAAGGAARFGGGGP